MHRGVRVALAFVVIAALSVVGIEASAAGSSKHGKVPLWVKHANRYPGGLSSGVRAYLDPALIRLQQKYGSSQSGFRGTSAPSAPATNLQVNSQDSVPPSPQNETQVAVSLSNPLNAVAASNDYVDGGLEIFTTHDGGNTWSTIFITPQNHATFDFCSGGDPSVAYSARDQAFYATQLCFSRAHPENEIQLIRSTDGGDHWTPGRRSAMVVSNSTVNPDFTVSTNAHVFYDKEQVVVDNNPESPHYGRVYVTYVKFHFDNTGFGDFCPAQLAYTDDVDADNNTDLIDTSWTHVQVMPNNKGGNGKGTSANQGVQPIVDDQGGVDIAFMSEDCNTARDRAIYFKRLSPDGTLGDLVRIDKAGQWKDNTSLTDTLDPKIARLPASTSAPIVFNPVTKALQYVVQNNINTATSGADISYTESLDYGQTWSDMVTVAVDGTGAPAANDQYFPWMAVDPTGATHVIWYDNRNDVGNLLIETFRVVTADTTDFSANENISTASWNPNISFSASGAFIGDYNGLAVGPGVEYPIWTDGRFSPGPPLGQTDIFTVPN